MGRILKIGAMLAIVAAIVKQWPDISRYLKMKQM